MSHFHILNDGRREFFCMSLSLFSFSMANIYFSILKYLRRFHVVRWQRHLVKGFRNLKKERGEVKCQGFFTPYRFLFGRQDGVDNFLLLLLLPKCVFVVEWTLHILVRPARGAWSNMTPLLEGFHWHLIRGYWGVGADQRWIDHPEWNGRSTQEVDDDMVKWSVTWLTCPKCACEGRY